MSDAKRLLATRLQEIVDKRAARQRGDFQEAASEPSHFVFGGNEHVTHAKLDRIFPKAAEAAKIERHEGKRLSPHSLRHSFGPY